MPEKQIPGLTDYRELMVSVRNDSTIRVNKMVYSVVEGGVERDKLFLRDERKDGSPQEGQVFRPVGS